MNSEQKLSGIKAMTIEKFEMECPCNSKDKPITVEIFPFVFKYCKKCFEKMSESLTDKQRKILEFNL